MRSILVTALVLFVGCTATGEVDKYDQTWRKDYGSTNCGEWLGEMTNDERFAGGADMLVSAWGVDGTEGELPTDNVVDSFVDDISTACEAGDDLVLNETAVGIYLIDKDRYGPP